MMILLPPHHQLVSGEYDFSTTEGLKFSVHLMDLRVLYVLYKVVEFRRRKSGKSRFIDLC